MKTIPIKYTVSNVFHIRPSEGQLEYGKYYLCLYNNVVLEPKGKCWLAIKLQKGDFIKLADLDVYFCFDGKKCSEHNYYSALDIIN